jgi:hypothetical protein
MRAVCAAAGVGPRRLIAEGLVGIGGPQRPVDLVTGMQLAVAVRLGAVAAVVALIPQGKESSRAVGVLEVGMVEIEPPVDGGDDHP